MRLGLAAVCAVAIGFALGHRPPSDNVIAASEVTTTEQLQTPTTGSPAVSDGGVDLSHVRIDHLGQLPFLQGYDFLRSAPPEELKQWANDLENLPVGPHRRAAIKDFFRILAQVDTKTAVDLVLGMSHRDTRLDAIGAVAAGAPNEGFAEVARMLTDRRAGRMDLTELVRDWSRFDPVSASTMLEQDKEHPDSGALSVLLENWAAQDPAAAQAWLNGSGFDLKEDDLKGIYNGLVSGWLEQDKKAAVNYLIANASNKQFSRAIASTTSTLFLDSKDAARTFVEDLPDGDAREAAISEMASYGQSRMIEENKPLGAAEVARWLISLTDPTHNEWLVDVLSNWKEQNSNAEAQWENSLSSESRDRLAVGQSLSLASDEVEAAIHAGLTIGDRRLREQTLRKVVAKVQASEEHRGDLKKLKLSSSEVAEINRIGAL